MYLYVYIYALIYLFMYSIIVCKSRSNIITRKCIHVLSAFQFYFPNLKTYVKTRKPSCNKDYVRYRCPCSASAFNLRGRAMSL